MRANGVKAGLTDPPPSVVGERSCIAARDDLQLVELVDDIAFEFVISFVSRYFELYAMISI